MLIAGSGVRYAADGAEPLEGAWTAEFSPQIFAMPIRATGLVLTPCCYNKRNVPTSPKDAVKTTLHHVPTEGLFFVGELSRLR